MRILVLSDCSPFTAQLLRAARLIAGPAGGSVTLLHVACPDSDFEGGRLREDVSRTGVAAVLRRRRRKLREAERSLRALGVEADSLMLLCRSLRGNPAPKLLSTINRLQPDLVVMGSPRHGKLYRLLVGGTADAVIRRAKSPVLLVPIPREKSAPPSALVSVPTSADATTAPAPEQHPNHA